MPTYEARYTIYASYFECMTLMPDSQPHYRSRRFNAENDEEARGIEKEEREEVADGLLGKPTIHLDSLVQVRDVRPLDAKGKQLSLFEK